MWAIFPITFGFIIPALFAILRIGIAVGVIYLAVRLIRRIFRR